MLFHAKLLAADKIFIKRICSQTVKKLDLLCHFVAKTEKKNFVLH